MSLSVFFSLLVCVFLSLYLCFTCVCVGHLNREWKTPFLGSRRRQALCGFCAGSLGPDAGTFLDYLRFRALTSVISAKHNAQMALRWVRYIRRPI